MIADSEIKSMSTTHWRRTDDCENDELVWLNIKSIDSYLSIFHAIALISLCNRFIFFDVDCENVKNRTHAYWDRSSRLTENFIEADSLVVVANSLNVVEADRSLKQKRNEAKRDSLDDAEDVTNLKIENFVVDFEWLFVDLMWDCCVWLLFFSLSSDVSTLKKMSIVEIKEWMSKTQERKSTLTVIVAD